MKRTNIEFTNYCEKLLAERGDSVYALCKAVGIKQAHFSVWKHNGSNEMNQKIGVLVDIARYLGISLDEFFGLQTAVEERRQRQNLPADISDMVRMLGSIGEADRKMIRLNIKNYYDAALEKKGDSQTAHE